MRYDLILTLFFSASVLNSSCQDKTKKIYEKWDNGKPKTIIEYINPKDTADFNLIGFYQTGDTNYYYSIRKNLKNGISRYYYDNGQLKYLINYSNDNFNGESKYWYKNGRPWQVARFRNGQLIDTLKDFYEDGKSKSTGTFIDGKGFITYYHPNGKTWKLGMFNKGKEEGIWTYYYPNGIKSSEGTYNNGLRNGDYKKYFDSGELMETGIYRFNIITGTCFYKKNGEIDSELNNFIKNNKNSIPWTEEQRKTEINKCISAKMNSGKSRADDHCYCVFEKIELFWSYSDYLIASESQKDSLLKLIDRLCKYE